MTEGPQPTIKQRISRANVGYEQEDSASALSELREVLRTPSTRRIRRTPLVLLAFLLVPILAACGAGSSEEDSLRRGDEAFARQDYPEALAEYRLALRQGSAGPQVLVRTAHAYAHMGRIDQARTLYMEAMEQDPTVADLAAADLLRVARLATDRGDGIAAAAAVDAALEVLPGVSLTGLALPLARHFTQNGQFGRALPYYQKAAQEVGNDPQILFEMAQAHEELGDCERAVAFFEQVRDRVSVAQRSEVDWHVGNCSFELARAAQERGEGVEALRLLQTMTQIGEPRNRLGQAWFDMGEIYAAQGECAAALRAFQQVQQEDLAGSFLLQRAREREDDIRFRRNRDRPC